MDRIFQFIKRCGLDVNPKEVIFKKTDSGNWAVYTGNAHQGIFIPKENLSEAQVKDHENSKKTNKKKNASKK